MEVSSLGLATAWTPTSGYVVYFPSTQPVQLSLPFQTTNPLNGNHVFGFFASCLRLDVVNHLEKLRRLSPGFLGWRQEAAGNIQRIFSNVDY